MSRTVCALTETGVTELNSEAPENTSLEGRFQGISANSLSLAVWGSRYSSHGQLLLTGKEWYKKLIKPAHLQIGLKPKHCRNQAQQWDEASLQHRSHITRLVPACFSMFSPGHPTTTFSVFPQLLKGRAQKLVSGCSAAFSEFPCSLGSQT